MTNLGSGPPDGFPAPATAPSSDEPRTRFSARMMERLDGALASAENTVLWPVHKLRQRLEEDLKESRGSEPREPLYVSYLKLPRAGPVTGLVVLMLGYIGVFGTLTYQQQSNYGTFGFDMGIYDQGSGWSPTSRIPSSRSGASTTSGTTSTSSRCSSCPPYWLGAGPHFLYAVETVWLAAGAIPIWLLGRDRLESSWMPLGLSAAYLLYPSVEWINQWHFHPDALIITPLMFAYWLATRQRWGWFWVAVAIVTFVQGRRRAGRVRPRDLPLAQACVSARRG
jgi:hypothetical protein